MRLTAATFTFLILAMALASSAGAQSVPGWSRLRSDTPFVLAMGGSDPNVLIALLNGTDQVRTLDGGKTWNSFTVQGLRPINIVASPTDSRTFYAMVGPSFYGSTARPLPNLYRSRDAGATWDLVKAEFGTPAGDLLGNLAVSADPNVLYATRMSPTLCFTGLCSYEGVEVFGSVDGGASWLSLSTGLIGDDVHVRAALSDATTLYAASTQGVFRSGDRGTSWQRVRAPEDGISSPELAIDREDAAVVYVRPIPDAKVWASEDSGATWRLAPALDAPGTGPSHAPHLLPDPVQRGRVYYVGDEGNIFESDDAARSWKRVALGSTEIQYATDTAIGVAGATRTFVTRSEAFGYRVEVGADALALGSDLWWNPATPGMGFTITQHASGQAFVAWFAYDAQGNPLWRVMPGGTWLDSRTFTGSLYQTRGPAYFLGSFDPSRVTVTPAGTATLHFADDNSADFSYRLPDGSSGDVPIVRELFAAPFGFRIPDYSDLWWNPAESGWGIVVSQQYSKVFAAWFVYDAAGNPLWVVLPDSTFTYDFANGYAATFRGDIYTTTGPPSTGPFDPARVTVTKVGSASLAFTSRTTGSLSYTAFGQSATRPISREPF